MKKATVSPITVAQLLKLLEESGFDVSLKGEKQMLEAANKKKDARARAVVAENIKIKGLILPDEFQIMINRDLPLEERVKTVLHELIHLRAPDISEAATEKATEALYRDLTADQLGRLEFLVS